MNSGLRTALIAAVVAVIAVFGYAQFASWRADRAKKTEALELVKKHISEQTAGAEGLLRLEYTDSSMTFADLFDRENDRTKKLEDAIVEVQSADIDPFIKAAASDYGRALQDALSAQSLKYRKGLALSNAIDTAKLAVDDYVSTPYNEYSDQYEHRRMTSTQEAMRKAASEQTDATGDFRKALQKLKDRVLVDGPKLPGFTLLGTATIDKALAKLKGSK